MVSKVEHYQKSKCPIACALDIIGDHWTLLVIRDLMFLEKKEYKEMMASDEGISSNILADRLKKLESIHIIASIPHPKSKLRKIYYLTDKGKDLVYIMLEIAKWSNRNIGDRILIPEGQKILLEQQTKDVANLIKKQLIEWEVANIK